jgi:hypothetical protein
MAEIDKDAYLRQAEAMVEEEGFTLPDRENLKAFIQSTSGRKVLGTLSIEAKNNIMRMGNIDFSAPTAPIEAQSLRGAAMALNSFIDTVFGLIEEEEDG